MTLPTALIIGGHPRSGTTILNRLCQLHPDIAMTGEFRSFLRLNVPYLEYARGLRMDWYRRGIVSHAGRRAPTRAKLLSLGFLTVFLGRLLLKARGPIGVQEVGWALHGIFPHAKLVGDKYPRYVFSLEDLVREEHLKQVIIYRDGRDVVSSYLQWSRQLGRTWISSAGTPRTPGKSRGLGFVPSNSWSSIRMSCISYATRLFAMLPGITWMSWRSTLVCQHEVSNTTRFGRQVLDAMRKV